VILIFDFYTSNLFPIVTNVHRYVYTKLEVFAAFSWRHGTDNGRTDNT